MEKGLVIGIDASRNRSGGAIAHLNGILRATNPTVQGIEEIHLWAYRALLDILPNPSWLIKHNPPDLEKSLTKQILWQYNELPNEMESHRCDILFCTDAASFCRCHPMVVMSQDMLQYEPCEMKHFGFSRKRLKLISLLWVQNYAMRFADGVIFLTEYAANTVQKKTGLLNHIRIIPHGVDDSFKKSPPLHVWPSTADQPISCVYVSHIEFYKHQWVVVKAIAMLRDSGYNIRIVFIGGASGPANRILENEIRHLDPAGKFVETIDFVRHDALPELLADKANIFLFASSCENLPVTLLEGMAMGLPIACSNRGPMPDLLKDGGIYFNPEDPASIAESIKQVIHMEDDARLRMGSRAKELSESYSWAKCTEMTFDFLRTTIQRGRPG